MISLLAAVNALLGRVRSISVQYVAPPPSNFGLRSISIDLEYSAPGSNPQFYQSASFLITDDPSTHSQQWKIHLPNRNATTYRWRRRLVFNSGLQTSTGFQSDTRLVLTVQPPFE
jgi:hypothetical protein